jgi:SPX domain protein involved in polyphosphate accumulation
MINDLLHPKHWRYERKFFVSELNKYEIESIVKLHPAMFSERYNERQVNNIYLDSFDMKNYFDNVSGKSHRMKVRIRWYGNLFGIIEQPVLEIKVKKGFLGGKISYPLEAFSMDSNLGIDSMQQLFRKSKIPDTLALIMRGLNFTVLNNYKRKYFESADRRFRITIDSKLNFVKLSHMKNSFLHMINDTISNILELKYDEGMDDYAEKITNLLPLRMTKSSKYIQGIELLSY